MANRGTGGLGDLGHLKELRQRIFFLLGALIVYRIGTFIPVPGIDPEALADAIERIAAGDAVFSPKLAGFVLDAFSDTVPVEADPELDQLTPREREVLRQIARGYAYKQVASRLSISVKTVETHVSAVLRKLQLSNRHELARWASERRIV